MKKLFIVAAVLMMLGSAVGCRCCDWLYRGAAYSNPCPPTVSYSDPCATTCGPCGDSCGPGVMTPGPAPYTSMPATQ